MNERKSEKTMLIYLTIMWKIVEKGESSLRNLDLGIGENSISKIKEVSVVSREIKDKKQ